MTRFLRSFSEIARGAFGLFYSVIDEEGVIVGGGGASNAIKLPLVKLRDATDLTFPCLLFSFLLSEFRNPACHPSPPLYQPSLDPEYPGPYQ